MIKAYRFDPHYTEDTAGVNFQVSVDGSFVSAYIAAKVLAARYPSRRTSVDWLGTFLLHQQEISRAVARRVRAKGPETVFVQVRDLSTRYLDGGRSAEPSDAAHGMQAAAGE